MFRLDHWYWQYSKLQSLDSKLLAWDVYKFEDEPHITKNYTRLKSQLRLGMYLVWQSTCPRQFPMTDVDTAGNSEAFKQLKDYIKHQSSTVGDSPWIFHGTDDSGGKRFVCKYAYKSYWKGQSGGPYQGCRFSLLVKWDKYGFYIHSSKPNPLYNFDGPSRIIQRKCVVGCEFHDHEDADDSDYVDKEQDEDDELSCSYDSESR